MSLGFVYAALNIGFPGRCKIGCTARHPAQRIAELKAHYRTKHEFVEAFSLMVPDPYRVEALAHSRLKHCRDWGTEMFVCSPAEAKAAILWAADEALRNPIPPRPERAPQRWQRARHSSPSAFWLWTLAAAGLITAWLAYLQPVLPDWLPEPVAHTASRIEGWF